MALYRQTRQIHTWVLAPAICLAAWASQQCKTRHHSDNGLDIQVVGGDAASPNQFPGLVYLPGLGCTGSKISKVHFLTAKHCIENAGAQDAKTMEFAVGVALSKLVRQKLRIRPPVLHKSSDLAIVRVEKDPLAWPHMNISRVPGRPFDDQVVVIGYGCFERPIELPGMSGGLANSNSDTTLTSGSDSQPSAVSGPMVPGLHYVVALISKLDRFVIKISKQDFKKFDPSLLPGLCSGDSGGPLLLRNGEVWEIIGVNSNVHLGTGENTFARIDKGMGANDMGNWLSEAMKF